VISAINGATFSASLRTGTTIETANAAGSEDGKFNTRLEFEGYRLARSQDPKTKTLAGACGARFYEAAAQRATP
jgi:hypothetical protein